MHAARPSPLADTLALHFSLSTFKSKDHLLLVHHVARQQGEAPPSPPKRGGGGGGAATPRHDSNAQRLLFNGKQRLGGAHVFRDEGMSAHPTTGTPPPRKPAKPGSRVCSVLFCSVVTVLFCFFVYCFVFFVFCVLLVLLPVCFSCVFFLPPLSSVCACKHVPLFCCWLCVCARGPCACKRSSVERTRGRVCVQATPSQSAKVERGKGASRFHPGPISPSTPLPPLTHTHTNEQSSMSLPRAYSSPYQAM